MRTNEINHVFLRAHIERGQGGICEKMLRKPRRELQICVVALYSAWILESFDVCEGSYVRKILAKFIERERNRRFRRRQYLWRLKAHSRRLASAKDAKRVGRLRNHAIVAERKFCLKNSDGKSFKSRFIIYPKFIFMILAG